MARDKGKSRRRQRQNNSTEDRIDVVCRREKDWQKRHIADQKQRSWRTVSFPHEGKYIGHVNAAGNRHGEGLLLGNTGIVYEGSWEDGQMSGDGVKTFPSGDRYEGCHVAGQRSGWGYYLWNCGDKYTGVWENNVMHGQGCFVWACGDIYTGSWKLGVISGKGHKAYADGSSVKGRFRQGSPHGWCVKTLAGGDVYSGCLVDGRRQGFGQYKWACGDIYTGMWVDDIIQGEGELLVGPRKGALASQEVVHYRGDFHAASRQGYGEGEFASGVRYLGHWWGDKPHGWGTMVYPNGDIGEGEFREGVMEGSGLMVFRSHDHLHMHQGHQGEIGGGTGSGSGFSSSLPSTPASPVEDSPFFLLACMSAIAPLPLVEELSLLPSSTPPDNSFSELDHSLFPESQDFLPMYASLVPLPDDLYRGPWRRNFPHGTGAMDYSSGNVFLGMFCNGLREGEGVLLRKKNKSAQELVAENSDEEFGGLLMEAGGGNGLAVTVSHGALSLVGWEGAETETGEVAVRAWSDGASSAVAAQGCSFLAQIEKCLQWGLLSEIISDSGNDSRDTVAHVGETYTSFSYEIVKGVWCRDQLKEVHSVC